MWLKSGWVFIVVLIGDISKLVQGLIRHFWICCVGTSCLPNSLISKDIGHWGKYSLNQVLKQGGSITRPNKREKDIPGKGTSIWEVRNKNHDVRGMPSAGAPCAHWGGWRVTHSQIINTLSGHAEKFKLTL